MKTRSVALRMSGGSSGSGSKSCSSALLLIASVSALSLGCAPVAFKAAGTSNLASSTPVVSESEVSCQVDATDYNFNFNIFAFQMTTRNGIHVGFAPTQSPIGAKLGLQIEGGDLDIELDATNPRTSYTQQVLGHSHLTSYDFSFEITAEMVSLGANTAGVTSVTHLSQAAVADVLKTSLKTLKANSPWSTRITKIYDRTHFKVPTGSKAGITSGDQFYVYEYAYPDATTSNRCAGEGFRKAGSTPIATVRPVYIDAESSVMEVTGIAEQDPQLGDGLEIALLDPSAQNSKAKKNEVRTLKRAIRITGISQAQAIEIPTVGAINLPSYFKFII